MDPLTAVLSVGSKVIDRLFPDPAQKAEAQLKLLELAQKGDLTDLVERASIVKTEAASQHWLAATWRPIVMLTFTALIVARWLGWTAPGLEQAEVLKLWDIVELGLGGYVIGRTAEKVLPTLASAMKGKG